MVERIYIEIGNICNLSCSFCVATKREKRQMSASEFSLILEKIRNKTKYIYLHVLGEPLLHPNLGDLLQIAKEIELPVCITTNGTLLSRKGDLLLKNKDIIHKVSVSLHSLEGNDLKEYDDYLKSAVLFAKEMAEAGSFIVFRLWNEDSSEGLGKNTKNDYIVDFLKNEYSEDWQTRPRGYRLAKNTFLEYDGLFTWPSKSGAEEMENGSCHGLKDQIAILADGTVVPCCLDCGGEISLGNIFENSLDEILNSPKALEIAKGFSEGRLIHPLCKKCTFARKFKGR